MMHVEHILVPADGSAESEAAFAWACDLARYYDAEITLLYIVDITKLGSLGLPGGPEKPQQFDHEQGKMILQKFCEETLEGVSVHTVSVYGDPGPEIIRLIDKHDINLVVMGSRGLGRVARWALGSVSTFVIHRAPCPVLTVKADTEA